MISIAGEIHAAFSEPQAGLEMRTIKIAAHQLTVEVTSGFVAMSRGLSYRTSLEWGKGMLFIYEHPRRASFWMAQVPFDIEILFGTADGVLRERYPMQAHTLSPTISFRSDILFAIECSRGWSESKKITFPCTTAGVI